jgi:NAD-dependent SIR2 family protein deacetylase
MHCSHCASHMAKLDTQKDGDTEQLIYECPTCGRTQLTTRTVNHWKEQMKMQMSRIGNRTLRQI